MKAETGDATTVLLVRHGHTAAIGRRLTGRLPGVHLTPEGREQARQLAAALARRGVAAIYSSPLERAIETASPLATMLALPIRIREDLNELDFGAWTGLTFEVLERLPGWARFNSARSTAEIPGGERPPAVQARGVRAVDALVRRHPGCTVAAFTHGDVIRSIVLHYTGLSLDRIAAIDLPPGSVAALRAPAALRADGKW